MSTHDEESLSSSLDFTINAEDKFYDVVDDPYYRDRDPEMIFEALTKSIHTVPFCDFLKRYIYEKAQMEGDLNDISVDEYREIILEEFHERSVPCSFTPTNARLRNLAKNWLTQQSVSRNVVLLLGFGLGMSREDVNDFLTKALLEPALDAKDPFEVICCYCYRNGHGYPVFEKLWNMYSTRDIYDLQSESNDTEYTSAYRKRLSAITAEGDLWHYISTLHVAKGAKRQSRSARAHFDELYAGARAFIAANFTEADRETSRVQAGRLSDRLDRNDQLYDYQKLEKIRNAREDFKAYTADEIGPGDVEQVLYCSVPRNVQGNMHPMKESRLNESFNGKRMTRQHISDILSGDAPVTRFDLITLLFFNFSQQTEKFKTVLSRYSSFVECSNEVLKDSGMSPLYTVNPYESFLLMCMLADDPLGTYSDVWEMSFAE